jgi:hypothetical protein
MVAIAEAGVVAVVLVIAKEHRSYEYRRVASSTVAEVAFP